MLKIFLLCLISLFPCLSHALSQDEKLNYVAFVMACEDSRSEKTLNNVASVLHTRDSRRTIDALYAVVAEKGQFDCFSTKPFTRSSTKGNTYVHLGKYRVSDNQLQLALKVAKESLSAEWQPAFRATNFYNPHLCSPKWARDGSKRLVYRDDGHVYMISKKDTGETYAANKPLKKDRWYALNMAVPPTSIYS